MYATLVKEFGGSVWNWKKLPEKEIQEWNMIRRNISRLRKLKQAEHDAVMNAGRL